MAVERASRADLPESSPLPRCLAPRRARAAFAILAVLLLVVMALPAGGCTQPSPSDTTMPDLAAEIGALKLDDIDFGTVLPAFTTEAYRANAQTEQADYQLFLAAKAADIGMVQKDTAKVTVTQETKDGNHTVTFDVTKAGGLFQVAEISGLTVTLVRAEGGPRPWLIEAVVLAR